jgi:hypothetical protein
MCKTRRKTGIAVTVAIIHRQIIPINVKSFPINVKSFTVVIQ